MKEGLLPSQTWKELFGWASSESDGWDGVSETDDMGVSDDEVNYTDTPWIGGWRPQKHEPSEKALKVRTALAHLLRILYLCVTEPQGNFDESVFILVC